MAAMPADQALPILQACGKLSEQDAFGDSTANSVKDCLAFSAFVRVRWGLVIHRPLGAV
jgi:hypothetical protein